MWEQGVRTHGSMPEWLMGADCKSAGYAYAGSNPARPTCLCSSVVEHTLGKGEVTSSILVKGFYILYFVQYHIKRQLECNHCGTKTRANLPENVCEIRTDE